jgi:DNA-binding response OmpR family regulator
LRIYDCFVGKTVLLVEDEYSIGSLVRTYLDRDGFETIWVRSGSEALTEVLRHPAELVILDIGLPDMDGFEVCRELGGRLPIIFLTARDEEADRVAGLELGADDYVAKPFSPRELTARVKAVLRRSTNTPRADVLRAGSVTLSRTSRQVWVEERPCELTAKEFDLLACLLEHPSVVISRESLLQSVWGLEFAGGTRTVDVHVGQLRKKLDRPKLIQTVRGLGYKAVAE